jgi:cellulose synthase/poly-beta-1,6-N-acetylglucosamine synthase-like glycosyltransferase
MIVLEVLLVGTTLLLLVPVIVLFVEVLLGVSTREDNGPHMDRRSRLAVIMPAHDEESIIATALRAVMPQLNPSDRMIVVADNCADQTASIAAAEGAEVIVRSDAIRRGKGYALDSGVRHLEGNAPEIVVIVDADCLVTPGSLDQLAHACARTARPVQALYLMHAPVGANPLMRIAEFAGVLKNRVRPLGLRRMGLPCQLMGTGMAFPWSTISTANLATGHIVEDLKLGIDLARAGTPPLFCPDAMVTSTFPLSNEGIKSQRTRWEHGHLAVILSDGPSLLIESVTTMNINLMALALDLIVPPLALLMFLVLGIWLSALIWYAVSGAQLPLALATLAGALLALSVLLSWIRFGQRIVTLGGLMLGVAYAVWKIPLYAKFLIARQLDWVRSKRDTR